MITRYLETFERTDLAAGAVTPDLVRYLHARLHLGKAVVLCDDPDAMLDQAQKQWRKLSRVLQQRRAFETNAVEIMKYTYTIIQMQHAVFSTQRMHDHPNANVYFARLDQIQSLPADCLSVYLAARASEAALVRLETQLPDLCLLVDYSGEAAEYKLNLKPRIELERSMKASWKAVEALLKANRISIARMVDPSTSTEAIDDAVDALLGVNAEFLAAAQDFQRKLDLARPLRSAPKALRDQYEAFIVLAHRVQTFSTGDFSPQFLRTYANDTFFLHDQTSPVESFADALRRHEQAGRANMVRAMVRATARHEPAASMSQRALAWAW